MPRTPLTPATIDQATIDRYIARGRRARSEALFGAVRNVFVRSGHRADRRAAPGS